MNLAFLGLGNMGNFMARNLLLAGHNVTVWNRTRSKCEEFRALGARIADSISGAAREAEIAITMLADDHAVSGAVLSAGGVAESLAPGAVHVSSSTVSVALSQQMAAVHDKRGQAYVAKLFIATAGDSAALERCQPVFAAIGQRTFVIGPKPELANVVKLSGNFLISAVIEALGEAVALTRKYGIDPHQYIAFLTSTLFAAPVYKTYGGIIADQRYLPAGFKMRLGLKDIRLVLAAAESVDAPMPFASTLRDHLLAAIGRGMEEEDWSALAQHAAHNAGLK